VKTREEEISDLIKHFNRVRLERDRALRRARALRRYARHAGDCDIVRYRDRIKCTCGLFALMYPRKARQQRAQR